MSLKDKVVLLWVTCLSYKVVMTGCEVVLVKRNVTADSFRVGKDGCTKNASVCTSSATCVSGLCLCSAVKPNFRNPVIIFNDKLQYGDSYGCIENDYIRFGVGDITSNCVFGPFQLVPYSRQNPPTKFSDIENRNVVFKSCSLKKAQAKLPDNATEMTLPWLNDSYVDLKVSNATLYFKWKRSVPGLRGTIISLYLKCSLLPLDLVVEKCLRAKVLGTWQEDENTLEPTNSLSSFSATTMTTSPTLTARFSSPGEISSSDGDSSRTIIAIAVVVPIVLLIVLVAVVWWLCKRKRGYSQRNSYRGNSGKKNGPTIMKPFRHTDSNLRGPDCYDDIPAKDTNKPFGAQTNLGSSTPDNKRVIGQANLTYSTPDIKGQEAKGASNNRPEPGYEPVAMKKRDVNKGDSQEDPGYATPDFNSKDIDRVNSYPEPGYETPDSKRKDVNDATLDPAYSMPDKNAGEDSADIKRVEINGNLYALPEKNRNTTKINGLNYMNPSQLVSDGQDSNESEEQASQPTEYAHIVGVMKPGPKKKKKM